MSIVRNFRFQFSWHVIAFAFLGLAACENLPRDDGQIWSCFGIVTEDVPGAEQPTDTNIYFGGCAPSDPGLQIVTYARSTATEEELIAACNSSCASAFGRYWQAHPDVTLPLRCDTLFVSACSDPTLGANTASLPLTKNANYFSGGPADLRSALSGTIGLSIDGEEGAVAASGVVDSTYAPCQGVDQSCPITLSRFDAIANETFALGSTAIEQAQVQMQGLGLGQQSATEFLIPAGAVNVEGNFTFSGERGSLHASNDQMIQSIGQTRGEYDFDLMLGQAPRTMHVAMTGSLIGSPPIASFTPAGGQFECTCADCTTVTLTSTTTDVDADVRNLSWLVDGQVLSTSQDDALSLQLPVGAHNVKLVATDNRGAASSASATLGVVDTTPPVLTVPPDVTLRSCDYPEIGRATAIDSCSQPFVTNNDPGDFATGSTSVIWSAEDEAGNVSRAAERVTVTQVRAATCCPAGYHIILVNPTTRRATGTSGNDCIIGTDNDDIIDGLGGDDYIVAGNGQDTITGGPGNDVIIGGEGNDTIDGGDGDDRISGGGGQDKITGGTGNDKIRGGRGDDTIHAGDGNDEVIGGDGQDLIYGEAGNDTLAGGPGDNQTLVGGDGDDVLSGGITQDHIQGGNGNDILIGSDGDDWLEGGSDNDILAGGKGYNQCVSGGGVDRYLMCAVQR